MNFRSAFYAERKSHLKLGCLSRNRSQSHSIFCRFRIHTWDTEQDLESQNFAPDQNRGRQNYYSEPEAQYQRIVYQTPGSKSEMELPKTLD